MSDGFDRIPDWPWDLDYEVRVDIGAFELGFGEELAARPYRSQSSKSACGMQSG
jgi:hypothetical protein